MLKVLVAKGARLFLIGHCYQAQLVAGVCVGISEVFYQLTLGTHPKTSECFGTTATLQVGPCRLQSTDLQVAAKCPRTPLPPRLLFPASDCRSLEHAVKGGRRVSPPLVPANFWGTYH